MKYKVKYTPTPGSPTITEVIEADSKEEAILKVPKIYDDMCIHVITEIASKAASENAMDIQKQLDCALSYTPESLLNLIPQLNMLFEQRAISAKSLNITGNDRIEHIDQIETYIKQLLGLKV